MSNYDELFQRFKRFIVQQQGVKRTDDAIVNAMVKRYLEVVETRGSDAAWQAADRLRRQLEREKRR